MTDTKLLLELIKNSGLKYNFIASCLDMSYQAFRNKLCNKSEFLPTEIEKLCQLLSITDLTLKNSIFFATFVE